MRTCTPRREESREYLGMSRGGGEGGRGQMQLVFLNIHM